MSSFVTLTASKAVLLAYIVLCPLILPAVVRTPDPLIAYVAVAVAAAAGFSVIAMDSTLGILLIVAGAMTLILANKLSKRMQQEERRAQEAEKLAEEQRRALALAEEQRIVKKQAELTEARWMDEEKAERWQHQQLLGQWKAPEKQHAGNDQALVPEKREDSAWASDIAEGSKWDAADTTGMARFMNMGGMADIMQAAEGAFVTPEKLMSAQQNQVQGEESTHAYTPLGGGSYSAQGVIAGAAVSGIDK